MEKGPEDSLKLSRSDPDEPALVGAIERDNCDPGQRQGDSNANI